MPSSLSAALLLVCLASTTLAAAATESAAVDESAVVVLTEANFDATLANIELALVEFYAPWCGHCKNLIAPFAAAATELRADGVVLAKVDATVEKALGTKYGVSGYPTLKIFRRGAVSSDYKGPRDAPGIAAAMRKQVGPSSKSLASAAEVAAFLAADPTSAAIVYFMTAQGSAHATWRTYTDTHRETLRFAETTAPDALAAYNTTHNRVVVFKPTLYVHPAFDTPHESLSGRFTAEELDAFVAKATLPLVAQYTQSKAGLYRGRPLVLAIFSCDFKRDPKGANFVANRVRKVAAAFARDHAESTVAFAIGAKTDFPQYLNDFGLHTTVAKHGLDGVAVIALDGDAKYKMEGAFSEAALTAFATSVAAGTAERYVKSEPLPRVNPDANGVTTVVGRNFASVVLDPNTDVFLEMYAPWCGHCKSLAPIWDELGRKFINSKTTVVAKMDATANDAQAPAFAANGYPTIYFAPAGKKAAPIKYDGERNVDAFVAFAKKHSGVKRTPKVDKPEV